MGIFYVYVIRGREPGEMARYPDQARYILVLKKYFHTISYVYEMNNFNIKFIKCYDNNY